MYTTKETTKPRYDLSIKNAQEYDELVESSVLYESLITKLMEKIEINQDSKILCIASGTGLDSRYVSRIGAKYIVGLELSFEMVKLANENIPTNCNNISYVQANASIIPFKKKQFDIVIINAAGEYLWNEIYMIFLEVKRVLKPNGIFAFNCQSDEIEDTHPKDPQRQLRREIYLVGQSKGFPVKLSALPSVDFFKRLALYTDFKLLNCELVGIKINIDEVYMQLQLKQFHYPFLVDVPSSKRLTLLNDAVANLKNDDMLVDEKRFWYHFTFKSID